MTRLAVRMLLRVMQMAEGTLDEMRNSLIRLPAYDLKQVNQLNVARKSQVDARKAISELLDMMIDSGVGD